MSSNKDQWIEDRREKFRCPHCDQVVGCSDDGVIGIFSKKIFAKHVITCSNFDASRLTLVVN